MTRSTAETAPVLVLGATGGQGGAVLRALLAAGRPVRALVRDTASASAARLAAQGVELAQGGFTDRAALATAMTGAAAAFALTTPFESGVDAELAQGRAILGAAADARLPHLVFASVAGATAGTGVPHFESKAVVERELVGGDLPHTIVAPAYFYDNALGGADDIRAGVLALPLAADKPLQQLDRDDLGRFVAEVLAAPGQHLGARYELAGDAPTPAAMAAALGAALDRPVRHEPVPLESIRGADMSAMWRFLSADGYQVDIAALRRDHPAVGWTSFDAWAHRAFPGGTA
ncbi:NmrA family NAD(P)-binding protein [Actinokineospora pegani]|uniref:NmrA family NAD(P)-binding protein n=1 Tax=Actinokineospora pegani TaxID=2654637 RepID=UPI0012EB03B3|nr:NmrA family NAD(P)-binding protein [Actinokineospora pegani]